jgi:hypothetical protein
MLSEYQSVLQCTMIGLAKNILSDNLYHSHEKEMIKRSLIATVCLKKLLKEMTCACRYRVHIQRFRELEHYSRCRFLLHTL